MSALFFAGCGVPSAFCDEPSSLPPSGPAGGDLSGNYPDPSVVDDSHNHTGGTLSNITDSSINAANKDGAAGTPSMRTLGSGAAQACAGNDTRLSNPRTPAGNPTGDLGGSYPNPSVQRVQGITPGAAGLSVIASATSADVRAAAAALGNPYTTPPSVGTLTPVHAVSSAQNLPNGGFSLFADGTANNQILAYDVAGTQLTVALIRTSVSLTGNHMAGISMRNSSTGEYKIFALFTEPVTTFLKLVTSKWSNYTTHVGNYLAGPSVPGLAAFVYGGGVIWLQITVSGANWIAKYSFDGVAFIPFDTQPTADFTTIDRIGVFLNPGGVDPIGIRVFSWG